MTTHSSGHADAARRWTGLTLMQQLANIGSEVERAIRAHEAGNESRFHRAFARALELFDLTAADDRWRGGETLLRGPWRDAAGLPRRVDDRLARERPNGGGRNLSVRQYPRSLEVP